MFSSGAVEPLMTFFAGDSSNDQKRDPHGQILPWQNMAEIEPKLESPYPLELHLHEIYKAMARRCLYQPGDYWICQHIFRTWSRLSIVDHQSLAGNDPKGGWRGLPKQMPTRSGDGPRKAIVALYTQWCRWQEA
jgi:hypothetical protein